MDLSPHWWYFAKPLALLLASIVLGIVSLFAGVANIFNLVVAVGILAALGWFGITYLSWSTTNFVVTTDRLISRRGVLSKDSIEIPLEKINTVFSRRSLFERIIGSGDLEIESAGEQGSQTFTDIRDPMEVQNEIYHQKEGNENKLYDRVGESIRSGLEAHSSSGGLSIPEQIEKLDDLRRRGALTDAEFDEKKAELLKRL